MKYLVACQSKEYGSYGHLNPNIGILSSSLSGEYHKFIFQSKRELELFLKFQTHDYTILEVFELHPIEFEEVKEEIEEVVKKTKVHFQLKES